MEDKIPDEIAVDPMDVKVNDTLSLFNTNESVTEALMSLSINASDEEREEVLSTRRKKLFKPLWENGTMSREFMLETAQEREQDSVEHYQDRMDEMDEDVDVPAFILRLQGQDELAEAILDKMAGIDSE